MRKRRPRRRVAVIHARSPRSPFSAFEVPVTLKVHDPAIASQTRLIDTRAMLDSGANICLIHPRFVREQSLPTIAKSRAVRLRTIDNSDVKSGLITHEVHLRVFVGDHEEDLVFDVAAIGDDNLILGINWLRRHNPTVDWERSTLDFSSPHCALHCLPKTMSSTPSRPSNKHHRVASPPPARPPAPKPPSRPSSYGKKTNTRFLPSNRVRASGATGYAGSTPTSASEYLVNVKQSRIRRRQHERVDAVRAARAVLDEAISAAVLRESQASSPDTSASAAASRPASCTFGRCASPEPDVRAAASQTSSQKLAEEDLRRQHLPKALEELVPPEFHEFLDVFSKSASDRLPSHGPHDLHIDLVDDATLPTGRLYQLSADELRALREFIDENLAKGYIRPSRAPGGAGVFFAKKKDGGLRLVVDYRALNSITRKDSYPIPLTSELIDRLKAARVFTTLDIRQAYYNLRIRAGDEWKTSFRTRYGQFEFLVMPFGLCNAPAAFQRMINDLFHDLVDVYVVLYLDDIIIFSEDPAQHDNHVREVLRRLREADLFAKAEKCAFRTTQVDYLGLKISPGRIAMDPVKVSGITHWPTPRNLRHVNQFLGFCNFYRRFVEDYANITRPLERLKQKDVAWRWGPEEDEAFEQLKSAFTSAPILMMPDVTAPFTVETDASDYATGAILSQRDSSGDLRPVAYYSKALAPAERNYDVYDKELLAIVRALEEWRPYLEGSPHRVTIYSDHKNLEYFMTTRDLNRRQARWSLFLNRFWFLIEHRAGHLSGGPDGLSRRPDHEPPDGARDNSNQTLLDASKVGTSTFTARACRLSPKRGVVLSTDKLGTSAVAARAGRVIASDGDILERIRKVSRQDERLKVVWEKEAGPEVLRNRLKDWKVDDGVVRYKGLIVVPDDPETKRMILELYHDPIPAGHPGRDKTLALVARNYYWPRMSEYIHKYVDGCDMCQRSKPRRQKPFGPLQPLEIPNGPWQHISVDFIGPLPLSDGFDAIMVVVDKLGKRAHFLRAHTTDTAEDTADLFIERVWCLHGTPKKVISDRGPQFIARFMRRIYERMGIKAALSTAHHPQTDGQTERVNQDLETYLRMYVDFYQDDWVKWLPFAEFAYNNRKHSATQTTPFFAEYGYHPTFSIDPVASQSVPKADARLDEIRSTQLELQSLLELAASRMKRFHDAWVDEAPDYIPGDRVYLERSDLRSTRPSHKLDFKRFGPFAVTQKLSDTAYRLKLPATWRIHDVFHVSHLIPARSDTILGRRQMPPPPEIVDGVEEQEIERVLKKRKLRSGVVEYLVRWKGFGEEDDEWLKEYDMAHAQDAIADFLSREEGRKRRQR